MFCQCYFTGQPALHEGHEGHAAMQYCRFNNAFKFESGSSWGDTKLDSMKFWMSATSAAISRNRRSGSS